MGPVGYLPSTAIAASNVKPGLPGVTVTVAWAGIVAVNVAAGWRGRRQG